MKSRRSVERTAVAEVERFMIDAWVRQPNEHTEPEAHAAWKAEVDSWCSERGVDPYDQIKVRHDLRHSGRLRQDWRTGEWFEKSGWDDPHDVPLQPAQFIHPYLTEPESLRHDAAGNQEEKT